MTNPRPHVLYRFYDADGELLYVGITLNPAARWADHQGHKLWWTEVTTITIQQHPTRQSVLDAERIAIIVEHPRHNVIHNRGHHPIDTTPPLGTLAADMPDDCHRHCVKAGHVALYYPYRWSNGIADYQCARGHQWTCGWPHHHTGEAPEYRGTPVEVYS